MAAVPFAAHAARKVRGNLSKPGFTPCMENNFSGSESDGEKADATNGMPKMSPKQVENHVMEHPPTKYNSKLMNSIWGLYNRYSVHNFKKNIKGVEFASEVFGEAQRYAVANDTLETLLYCPQLGSDIWGKILPSNTQ